MNDENAGSRWLKCDLQVHTPVDRWVDFPFSSPKTDDEKKAWAAQLVQTAEEKNVELIALTEHNDGSYIDLAIRAAKKSKVTVLPGVEITSQEGIHVIALFDPERQLSKEGYGSWDEFVSKFLATLGIKGNVLKRGVPVNTQATTIHILEAIERDQGLSFFPHAFNHNGSAQNMRNDTLFGYSTGQTKMDIYCHRLCKVVQIPSEGKLHQGDIDIVSGKSPQYGNKRVACITASDTRSFSGLGENKCWIKASPSFEGLKQILYAPNERVFIGEVPPSYLYSQVTNAQFSGTNEVSSHCLPNDQPICLSPNLNVIIGGRGTGKTTLLESIAYIFDEQLPTDDEHVSAISQTIEELENTGQSGTVKIGIQFGQNTSEISRDFSYTADKPSIGFGIAYWRQGDIEKHAYSASKLRKLLQPLMTTAQAQSLEETITTKIEKARSLSEQYSQLPTLEGKVKSLKEKLAQHKSILETVQDKKFQQLIGEMKALGAEKNKLDMAVKALAEYEEHLATTIDAMNAVEFSPIDWPDLLSTCGIENLGTPETMRQTLSQNLIGFQQLRKDVQQSNHYKDIAKQLSEKHERYAEVAQKLGVKLTQTQVEESGRQILSLERDIQKLEKQIEELKGYTQAHADVITELENARKSLADERVRAFARISSELGNGVEIRDGEEYSSDEIATIFSGYAAREKLRTGEMAILLKEKLSLPEIVDYLRKRTVPPELKGALGGTAEWFFSSAEYTQRDLLIMKLSEIQPVFAPTITQNGKMLDELSFGERCALVLRIVLGYGTQPLMIDQPEDHLDNEFITETLLDMLKEKKNQRQIILATHNPNIVVNADAENVIILRKPTSKGKKCQTYQGGLEDKKIRDMVATILEGGREAFKKREERYEF